MVLAGGTLVQDGDLETLESRWSCKPELGDAGSTCSIAYRTTDPLYIDELNIGELLIESSLNVLFLQ